MGQPTPASPSPAELSPVAAQVTSSGAAAPADNRAFAAVVATIDRLDALGLIDECGMSLVEPATTFEPVS